MVKITIQSFDEVADGFTVLVDSRYEMHQKRVDALLLRLAVRDSVELDQAHGRTFEIDYCGY